MNTPLNEHGYRPVAIQVDLGKEDPAIVTLDQWKQDYYFGIRFYWTNEAGELRPGKNGITVQAGYGVDLIKALIEGYNLATDNEYVLATMQDGEAVALEEYDE